MTGELADADPGEARPRRLGRALSPFNVLVVVVFALQPFVALLAANRTQIHDTGKVVAFALLTAALALVALAAIATVRPRLAPDGLAIAVAIGVLSFFNFSVVMGSNPPSATQAVLQFVFWAILTGAVATLAYRLSRYEAVRRAVAIFGVVFLAVPLLTYVSYRLDRETPTVSVDDADVPELAMTPPNVYWFILDGYGRNDQLDRVLGLDNAEFYGDLEERGFAVSETSTTSYPRTHLSLASTLEMEFVAEPGNDIADEFVTMAPVLKGANATVDRFRAHGYQFIYSDHGSLEWSQCNEPRADLCLPAIEPPRAIDELERSILDLTPLRSLSIFPTSYTEPAQVIDELAAVEDEVEEPFFLIAHVGSPHWPYRFRDDCSTRSVPLDAYRLTYDERREAYETDLRCLNERMLAAIDEIDERDPDAVIIVQSDHGSDFLTDWDVPPDEWSNDSLAERYAALNAMRLPAECDDGPVEGLGLVNTFRLVFACLEGREPDLLPERMFLSPWEQIDEVEEIEPERLETDS
jgi:hypothetical protein